jgi:thiamine-monophosphate kinase
MRGGWRCTATIALDAIPFTDGVQDRLAAASWGDDYELLFAAPDGATLPVPATRIGALLPVGAEALLLDGKSPPEKLGYEHR